MRKNPCHGPDKNRCPSICGGPICHKIKNNSPFIFTDQDKRVLTSLLQGYKMEIDRTMHSDEGLKMHSIMYIDTIIEKIDDH